jgi:hypothetical protein
LEAQVGGVELKNEESEAEIVLRHFIACCSASIPGFVFPNPIATTQATTSEISAPQMCSSSSSEGHRVDKDGDGRTGAESDEDGETSGDKTSKTLQLLVLATQVIEDLKYCIP